MARFDGGRWSTLALEHKARCLAELERGVVLMGTDHGLTKVNFDTRKAERVRGYDGNVFNSVFGIAVTPDGTVLCASYGAFFERTKRQTKQASAVPP